MTRPTPQSAQPRDDGQQFDVVRRGYDPGQVDPQVAALRAALEQTQRAAEVAEHHAAMTERELREARHELQLKQVQERENSFGYRVEQLLVAAERDAHEIRLRAAAEVEARQTKAEQQLAQRGKAIEEQRRRTAEQHAVAIAEIRAQRAEVEEQAKVLREQVSSECRRLQTQTTDAITRRREEADRQLADRRRDVEESIAQLNDVRRELLADLRQVHAQLGNFIDKPASHRRAAHRSTGESEGPHQGRP